MASMTSSDLWPQILAAPGDANLKAQYVEALAQEGNERAEMFRLATELKNLIHGYFQREAELKSQYEPLLARWRTDFDVSAKTWQAKLNFIQGWPCEIAMQASDFALHAATMVATVPLRHLNLTAIRAAPEVFEVAQLSQIASIDGSHQAWSNEAINALSNSPHLTALRWLDLSHTGLKETQVEILAASPQLRNLEHLDLQNNPCRDPVDAAAGCGVDGISGYIVPESIWLPEYGHELEACYGEIHWLHALGHFMEQHPPSRYLF